MSLINEALRRARLEAARQEAARRGDPPPVLPAALPDRHRFPWGHFATALILGIVVAGTAIWLLGWHRSAANSGLQATARETRPQAHAALPAAAPSGTRSRPAVKATATAPRSPAASPVRSEATPSGTGAIAAEQAKSAPGSRKRPQPRITEEEHRPTTQGTSRVAEGRGLVDGYTYVGSIDIAGHHLALGGIAWSANHPTAVLNDAAVSKGDEVAGFRVVDVEPDRVKLSADGKTFFLRLP